MAIVVAILCVVVVVAFCLRGQYGKDMFSLCILCVLYKMTRSGE